MSAAVSPPDLSFEPDTGDQQLQQQIRRQLLADSRAAMRLEVEVDEGIVTLRGTATSFYQKQLWLHGTKRVAGDDVRIRDEIQVTVNWDTSDLSWRD